MKVDRGSMMKHAIAQKFSNHVLSAVIIGFVCPAVPMLAMEGLRRIYTGS
jgi:xanthosine utilization system XapX-like protein